MKLIEWLKEMDNAARMRLMLTLVVVEFVLIFATLSAITITSQPSFCNICHEMRADVRAWKSSSHAEVTCYSCHSEGNLTAFLVHKVESLKEVYFHLTNEFEKPINGDGEYGWKMSNEPCKRCHSLNRRVTPHKGIIIDHLKHEQKSITCVTCHNRAGHPTEHMKGYVGEKKAEEAKVKIAFKVGKEETASIESKPYEDRIKMRFCMVCHTGEKGKGPRECETCHPPGFELKPEDHNNPDWLPPQDRLQSVHAFHAKEAKARMADCLSCHQQKFCVDCHGVEIPHPEKWKNEHKNLVRTAVEKCIRCHPQTNFCEACHHQYNPAEGPWVSRLPGASLHPNAVRVRGAADCFNCHNPVFCAHCHVRGSPD